MPRLTCCLLPPLAAGRAARACLLSQGATRNVRFEAEESVKASLLSTGTAEEANNIADASALELHQLVVSPLVAAIAAHDGDTLLGTTGGASDALEQLSGTGYIPLHVPCKCPCSS